MPPQANPSAPNPKRVAAGKKNRLKRTGLTPAGRTRLRDAAQAHQPWRFSTGPRTAAGKAQAARNGKSRQQGPFSVRALRAELAEIRADILIMAELRDEALHTGWPLNVDPATP